ncbi:MafI family immunity protein [Nocardia sp. NPDC050175]|uniref:MafI family immunity protein n=1 Tax=Nocardia sp. NPDC050175 TaxID=3364317 RepID=UPI00379DB963
MTDDQAALRASWDRTAGYLDAAQTLLSDLPNVDLSPTREFLEHNELGLAFDYLVYLGHDLDVPQSYWQHLDHAAHEMRLYSPEADKDHRASAEICRLHLEPESGIESL